MEDSPRGSGSEDPAQSTSPPMRQRYGLFNGDIRLTAADGSQRSLASRWVKHVPCLIECLSSDNADFQTSRRSEEGEYWDVSLGQAQIRATCKAQFSV